MFNMLVKIVYTSLALMVILGQAEGGWVTQKMATAADNINDQSKICFNMESGDDRLPGCHARLAKMAVELAKDYKQLLDFGRDCRASKYKGKTDCYHNYSGMCHVDIIVDERALYTARGL